MRNEEPKVHELSIALSLLDEIEHAARREGAFVVSRVRLRVGRSSGVSRDALMFAWELARADTIAASAELTIDDVALAVFCTRCNRDSSVRDGTGLVCGICGAPCSSVVAGRELELVAMEITS